MAGLFREDIQTVADMQRVIRSIWKWYEKCAAERGMNPKQAVEQAYGCQNGIIEVMTYEAYNEVFTDEFRAEWEDWRFKMLAL